MLQYKKLVTLTNRRPLSLSPFHKRRWQSVHMRQLPGVEVQTKLSKLRRRLAVNRRLRALEIMDDQMRAKVCVMYWRRLQLKG